MNKYALIVNTATKYKRTKQIVLSAVLANGTYVLTAAKTTKPSGNVRTSKEHSHGKSKNKQILITNNTNTNQKNLGSISLRKLLPTP